MSYVLWDLLVGVDLLKFDTESPKKLRIGFYLYPTFFRLQDSYNVSKMTNLTQVGFFGSREGLKFRIWGA